MSLDVIQGFCGNKQQEDLHLEFKQLSERPWNRDDKKNLAKVISGFANSAGGICVWGVEARPDEDKVDAANKPCPIGNLQGVYSCLQALTGEASEPIPDGVAHRMIPQEDNTGYIVTYVPGSDSGPHMAKLGVNRFYKRSGDSFYLMEVYDIADMFGRRRRAVPALRIDPLQSRDRLRGRFLAQVVLSICNRGRAILTYPQLRVTLNSPLFRHEYLHPVRRQYGLPLQLAGSTSKGVMIFRGGTDDFVHVGTYLDVTRLEAEVSDETGPKKCPDLTIAFQIHAEGADSVTGEYTIPAEILKRGSDPIIVPEIPALHTLNLDGY